MKFGLSLILFTACATTGTTMQSREPAQHARIELDLAAPAPDRAPFPAALEPTMPSVDRVAHQLRFELGDAVQASLDLCVAPDGRVTNVALVDSTRHEALDAAILRDAREWQFASRPGSTATANLQTCERASLKYLMPR
jgi:TonB family protein